MNPEVGRFRPPQQALDKRVRVGRLRWSGQTVWRSRPSQ